MRKRILVVGIIFATLLATGWMIFQHDDDQSSVAPVKQAVLNANDDRFAKGDPNAPVKIVEYADVLCPYCAKVNAEVIPQIQSEYVDTGKAYYELRLVGVIAPDSMRAAEGAYCAAEHGKFWDYMNKAYETTWDDYYSKNQEPNDVPLFTESNIKTFARQVGITDSFEYIQWHDCMQSNKYQKIVKKNKDDMSKMEAYGTPHFSINGKDYNGSPPYRVFKGVIEAALNESGAEQ